MDNYYEKLVKKIKSTHIFIVLGTENYIKSLKNQDKEILTQIKIATELEKPFFIVIDNKLSNEDIEYILNYFENNNIIKIMRIDMEKEEDAIKLAEEIKMLARKESGSDENVKVITPYSIDNEDVREYN